ncbi:MAG: hypothetical protein KBH93_06445 [Anaerolineae bacterium]|nr:hypothetical protein [Anaerolineae bacterium]
MGCAANSFAGLLVAVAMMVIGALTTVSGTAPGPTVTVPDIPPSPLPEATLTPPEAALAVLDENAAAIVAEDLDRYLATLHEDAPLYEVTADTMRALFESYDLDVSIEGAEVLAQSDEEIVIRVVQVTRRISGTDFADNRRTLVHTLRLSGSVWKIYRTDVFSVEYFS